MPHRHCVGAYLSRLQPVSSNRNNGYSDTTFDCATILASIAGRG
jgi:hypothetical protein